MNADALNDLVACLDLLPDNFRVLMLTSLGDEECRAMGIRHPRIERDWVSVAESGRLVREADLLFLPLSFKNCSAEEVRTVFSTKTLDYLTSGVPILVYSPADSYHSLMPKAMAGGTLSITTSPKFWQTPCKNWLLTRICGKCRCRGLPKRRVAVTRAVGRGISGIWWKEPKSGKRWPARIRFPVNKKSV